MECNIFKNIPIASHVVLKTVFTLKREVAFFLYSPILKVVGK